MSTEDTRWARLEELNGPTSGLRVSMNDNSRRDIRYSRWCAPLALLALCAVAVSAQDTLPKSARLRVLTVVDAQTGEPVGDAQVINQATGAGGLTGEKGTVSLAFLQSGTTLFTIRKIGYRSDTISIVASARDTTPVTVRLTPALLRLSAVVTTARAAGDTVRSLELAGFYHRKRASGAPPSAFITADQIEKWHPSILSDLKYHTGRDLSRCSYYMDGVRMNAPPARRGSSMRQGIDALVSPDDVAGLEVYTHASEVPAQYNMRRDQGCVVLIWTKA